MTARHTTQLVRVRAKRDPDVHYPIGIDGFFYNVLSTVYRRSTFHVQHKEVYVRVLV